MSQMPEQPAPQAPNAAPPPPGAPMPGQPGGMPPGAGLPKGLAIASMVCGIVALVLFCIWFISIPTAIVAIILGVVAKGKVKSGQAAGGGMATAGLVCGTIGLVLAGIYIAWVIWFVSTASSGLQQLGDEIRRQQEENMKRLQQNNSGGMLPAMQQNLEMCMTYVKHYLG